MKIVIRQVAPSDHSFIFATYLRNRWFDKANNTILKRATWSTLQHKRIEKILEEGKVLVACLSEDPDTITGYTLRDGDNLYTYIKLRWRSPGLAIEDKLVKEFNK